MKELVNLWKEDMEKEGFTSWEKFAYGVAVPMTMVAIALFAGAAW